MNANPPEPLLIPTYVEGNEEAVHPSVVDTVTGWNGYRYWMAFTPYPNTDSAFENPSIVASHDGNTWVVPSGLTNPVEAAPTSGFWSDTHLVLHGGVMHMFWRGSGITGEGGNETTHLRTSTDGVTWTARTTVLALDPAVRRSLSPAVVRDADGTWRMWFVDIIPTPFKVVMYTAAAPEGPWSFDSVCQLPAPDGLNLWHLDVQARGGAYWMLLQTGASGGGSGGLLYMCRSVDGRTWARGARAVVGKRGNMWDRALYRGCMTPHEGGGWDVWYGSSTPAWRIGRTRLDLLSRR
jgi:hypothetical protein